MATPKRRYKPPKADGDTFATQEEFLNSLVPVPLDSVPEINRKCSHCWKMYGDSDEGLDNAEQPVMFRCGHTFGEKCMKELYSLPETVELPLRSINPEFPPGSHEAMLVHGLEDFLNHYAEAYAKKNESSSQPDAKAKAPPRDNLDLSVDPAHTSEIFAQLLQSIQRNRNTRFLKHWSSTLMHLLTTQHKIVQVHFHSNGITYDSEDQPTLDPVIYPYSLSYPPGTFQTSALPPGASPFGPFDPYGIEPPVLMVDEIAPTPPAGAPPAGAPPAGAPPAGVPPASGPPSTGPPIATPPIDPDCFEVAPDSVSTSSSSTTASSKSTSVAGDNAPTVAVGASAGSDSTSLPPTTPGEQVTATSQPPPFHPLSSFGHAFTTPPGGVFFPVTGPTAPPPGLSIEQQKEHAQKYKEYQEMLTARQNEMNKRNQDRIIRVASDLTKLYARYTDLLLRHPESASKRPVPTATTEADPFSGCHVVVLNTRATIHSGSRELFHYKVPAPYGATTIPPNYESEDEQDASDSTESETARMMVLRRAICNRCYSDVRIRAEVRAALPVPEGVSWKDAKKGPDSCPICAKILFHKQTL